MRNYFNKIDEYLDKSDWEVNENSNAHYSYGALKKHVSDLVMEDYWLGRIYDKKVANAHINGDFHIHDLGDLTLYCCGYSMRDIIEKGIRGISNLSKADPAKHFDSLLAQMANIITVYQNEIAGAVAFSSFDTYAAPFVKEDNLSYEQVYQEMQKFIWAINSNSRMGCVPEETELLTEDGFKKYYELSEGDLVYTYKDGELRLQPIKKMNIYDYDGELVSFKGRDYNQTVTPNHRVLRKEFNKKTYKIQIAEELENIETPLSFPIGVKTSSLEGIDLSNEMIELLAFVLTEGSVEEDRGRIRIYKSENRWGNERLQEILDILAIKYSRHEYDSEVGCDKKSRKYPMNRYDMLSSSKRDKIFNLINGTKEDIPNILLKMNKEQANLFIKTWSKLDGDGDRLLMQCDNETIADKIQYICTLAGYGSKKFTRVKSESNQNLYIQAYKRKNKINNTIERVEYKGKVWCPTTEDGIVFFRENGKVFISGNSEPAFTNLTFDITPSRDIIDQKVWFNGTRLDYTYRECQQEMDLINRAFYQIMLNGDANDAPHSYPIPTYNIHERFDWDNPNNEMLWEMAGKYGIPYFANFLNSEMNPEDVRSMCCRIQLDKRELRRRGGGLFGADEHTGSIGVVTMNLPRYAFIAKNEEQFFQILENKMEVAKNSLEQKRKFITERVLKTGLTPAFIEYVGKLDNHFSTIGFVGQNEMCLNLFNESIKSDKGHNFSVEVLKFMREKVADFQEETGNLYNLEASPAESTAYRLALKDREEFGDLIATQIGANNEPYYTNSCHLAVKDIESITQLYEHQNDLQKLPTGGTVIHNYYNQPISGEKIKKITKTICENYEVPYISHSPLYSVCPIHGQLQGFYNKCPECGTVVESYQRITGYIRPISKFNNGKKAEFFDRSQLKI